MRGLKIFILIFVPIISLCNEVFIKQFDLNKTIELSSYDSNSKQLALYDKNGDIIVFDLKKFNIKTFNRYGYEKILSLDFKYNKIYAGFLNGDIIVFNSSLTDSYRILHSQNSKISKVLYKNNKIFAIYDNKNILIYDIDTKKSSKIKNIHNQKINSLIVKDDLLICSAGWDKIVQCYDFNGTIKYTYKIKDIATCLFYCSFDKEIIVGDISGNIYKLNNNLFNRYNKSESILSIACSEINSYIAKKNGKILVLNHGSLIQLFDIKDKILSIFFDNIFGLIVVKENGGIYMYN